MQETMKKVDAIITKYSDSLACHGIKISAVKRYFETQVNEYRMASGDASVFDELVRAKYRKEETKEGYHHQNNRYHCIVLTVAPMQKGLVRRSSLREYAFLLKKVERAHIGLPPKKFKCIEQKILFKIEKRILKILKKAQKSTTEQVCKDTFCDAVRYAFPRYSYKHKFLGKDRETWELIFPILASVVAGVIVVILWLIGKAFC